MRTDLFIKNFLHFSPRSLNAWYIGGALIVSSVLVYTFVKPGDKVEVEVKDKVEAEVEAEVEVEVEDQAEKSLSDLQETFFIYDSLGTGEGRRETEVGSRETEVGSREKGVGSRKAVDRNQVKEGGLPASLAISPIPKQPSENITDRDITSAYIGQRVIAWFKCSLPVGCVPLSTSFINYSQNAIRYSWSFGDGGRSELASPFYIFDEPGTWFVSLTAFSENNEISIFTDSIRVNPKPVARFSMDIQGLPGDELPVYFYNYSRGAENYLWDFGDGSTSNLKDPDHYFGKKARTNIKLLAFSEAGCSDSTILQDIFKEGEPVFIFPTAFSPGTTGPGTGQYSGTSPRNDVFYPYVEEDPEEYQLRIFNRSGILLFESNDIHFGWDGYYREVLLSQGVYVWKARAKFSDGRSVVRMGDVTLLWGE